MDVYIYIYIHSAVVFNETCLNEDILSIYTNIYINIYMELHFHSAQHLACSV